MMKKTGFTLAEVLITLAIIGVVATLTLPALMTNTAEQQAKTALKKGINTLTEAAQMSQAIAGFDYASLTTAQAETDPSPDDQSLYGLLATRASVDFTKSKLMSDITPEYTINGGTNPDSNYALFFRDGSALLYPRDIISSTAPLQAGTGSAASGTTMMPDNLVYGICAVYDTNGTKGPNILSNCQGSALGSAKDDQPEGEDLNVTCASKNRVIKDQFGVRLRGGYAVPNGAAARWAFEN